MAPSRCIQFNPPSHFVGTAFWGYKARGGKEQKKIKEETSADWVIWSSGGE